MSIEMADLPETFEEFMEEVSRTSRLEEIAGEAGAAGECFCTNAIIDLDVLSSAVRNHYDLNDAQETTFSQRATDTELDLSDSGMCAQHANAMAKDD